MEHSKALSHTMDFSSIISTLKNRRVFLTLWLITFIIIAFFLYSNALTDVPKRDQVGYLREHVYFNNPWDWFLHSVSYNRTRFINGGDYYLFRPAFMALQTLTNILFENLPEAIGVTSVLTLAIVAFCLSRFAASFVGNCLGFLLGLTFLSNYAGMEMILWRHISFYLVTIAFFSLGCYWIIRSNESIKAKYFAGSFLFLGMLFHESTACAILSGTICFIFFHLIRKFDNSLKSDLNHNDKNVKLLIPICGIPLAAFTILDVIDLIFHQVPSILNTADVLPKHFIIQGLNSIIISHEAFSTASFFPFFVKLLSWDGLWIWKFEPHSFILSSVSIFLFAGLIIGIYPTLKRFARGESTRVDAAVILAYSFYMAIVLGVGLGRVLLRTVFYLQYATYYHSLAAGALCMVLAAALYNILGIIKCPIRQRLIKTSVGTYLLTLIVVQSLMIHTTLSQASLVAWSYKSFDIFHTQINNKYYAIPSTWTVDIITIINNAIQNPGNFPYLFEGNTLENVEQKIDKRMMDLYQAQLKSVSEQNVKNLH